MEEVRDMYSRSHRVGENEQSDSDQGFSRKREKERETTITTEFH